MLAVHTLQAHQSMAPGLAHAAVLVCLLAYAALSVWFGRRRDGPDDSEGNGGGPGPPPDPPPDEPGWWPDFEREFAAYVEARSEVGAGPKEESTHALTGD